MNKILIRDAAGIAWGFQELEPAKVRLAKSKWWYSVAKHADMKPEELEQLKKNTMRKRKALTAAEAQKKQRVAKAEQALGQPTHGVSSVLTELDYYIIIFMNSVRLAQSEAAKVCESRYSNENMER
ncbi:hypothetical protein COCNU_04G015610 [Cocos nucifera]|uniref:Uncharacterized protein n=1 Tax=Cocos nucifera TaxID=13894 RepID=A0A8K0I7B3_COCNU|nr:hypothetical protein COCNU_04G015610 [Cocos nucifera]